jgi:hypothetical protein
MMEQMFATLDKEFQGLQRQTFQQRNLRRQSVAGLPMQLRRRPATTIHGRIYARVV